MNKLLKIWEFLSGKKTVTSAVLKALADVLTVVGQPEAAYIIDQLGNFLLTVGLAHKGAKVMK